VKTHSQRRPDGSGLYVHVPFCDGKCRYCGFYSKPIHSQDSQRLVLALIAEAECYRGTAVRTLYVGGGSPTSLPLSQLAELLDVLASRWSDPAEFTVECNPGQTDASVLEVLRDHGVNRLSFGVQSFHEHELKLLGRRHSVQQARDAVRQALNAGFDNVGIDLIFAIPGSTIDSWRQSLESAVSLGVPHISAYSLSYEPDTALTLAADRGEIARIDEDTDRAMYDLAIDHLDAAGIAQYEISNFARPDFECLHNQGYWENRPYIGIGPSAASYWQAARTTNVSDISAYVQAIEAGCSPEQERTCPDADEQICETAILNLRRREGVNCDGFRLTTGVDFLDVFAGPVERYRRLGLLDVDAESIRLSRNALAVADSVLVDFAAIGGPAV
jgi:oxygen-independent coproporphyrinogen III oxidase